MTNVDVNSDLGEHDGPEWLAREAALVPLITSVNIACGTHAGTPLLMRETARLAAQYGVAIGAHPGFPDTGDFGRQDRETAPDEIERLITPQLKILADVLAEDHLQLTHVKPHGALYHLAAGNDAVADAVVRAVAAFDSNLCVYARAGSALVARAKAAGLSVIQEAFADRGYRRDGTLVPRPQPGSLLQTEREVRRRLRELINGFVTSVDGRTVPLQTDSICIHADTANAVELACLIRNELASIGVRVARVR